MTSARLAPDLLPSVDLALSPVEAARAFALDLGATIGEPATGDDIRAAIERIREVLGELAALAGEQDLAARRRAMLEAAEAPRARKGRRGHDQGE